MTKKKPYLFAHRGASGYETENSIKAFHLAIEMGADGIETDVFEIATGELIIFHDSAIQVPGDEANTPCGKLTKEQIESITLENGEKIPYLEDLFTEFRDVKNKAGGLVKFSIDIQNSKAALSIAQKVIDYQMQDRVELCSTTPAIVLKKIRKQYPNLILVASNSENLISEEACSESGKLGSLNLNIYNFQAGHLTKEVYNIVKKSGAKVYMWDLHDEENLKKNCTEFELDAVYSNYPDKARKIIDKIFN